MKRQLRMGMIGGGRGAFIGRIHRMAAALEGRIEVVPSTTKLKQGKTFFAQVKNRMP